MKALSKKIKVILTASLASVVGVTSIITPIAINYSSQNSISNQNKQYSFNGEKYDSLDDVMKYVDGNTTQKEVLTSTSHMWSMNTNGNNNFYYSPNQLTEEAFKNIKVYDGYTSMKYNDILASKGALNEISKKTISKMDLQPVGSNGPTDTVKVYQGKNDSIFTDENQAKKTFYSIHEGYNFDGIYFRNKTDLRQYLDQSNRSSKKSSEYFTIKNINDTNDVSLPISASSISQLDFSDNKYLENEDYVKIRNFVQNSATSYISLKDGSNVKYFNSNDNYLLSEILPYVKTEDLEYTKVYSSQGESTYIVDVSKEDSHGISGPYFYSGGGNILSSKDKDQWSKFNTFDDSTNAAPIDEIVSSFTDVLLNESQNISEDSIYKLHENEMIFYFYETGNLSDPLSGISLNNQWFNLITTVKKNHFNLYKNILETYSSIKETKKFNGFYKLPILFILFVQGLMRELASNTEISMVRDFFTNLCLKMDRTLSYFNNLTLNFGLDLLKDSSTNKNKFSFVEFFKFNNPDYDLNSNINTFLSNMVQYYPNLILFIVISNVAIGSSVVGVDMIDPFIADLKKNIKLFGITMNESIWNNKALSLIFSIFSSCESNYVFETLKPYNSSLTEDDVVDALLETFQSNAFNFHVPSNKIKELLEKDYEKIKNPIQNVGNFFVKFTNTWLYTYLIKLPSVTFKEIQKAFVYDNLIGYLPYNFNPNSIVGYAENSLIFLVNLQKFLSNNIKRFAELLVNLVIQYFKTYYELALSIFQICLDFLKPLGTIEYWEESNKIAKKISEFVSPIKDITEKIKEVIDDKIKKISELIPNVDTSTVTNILEAVSKFPISNFLKFAKFISNVNVALTAFTFVLDLLVPKTENYSYQFKTSDNTTFTWNGGQKTTMFLGLVPISETTIEEMKFIDPILIQHGSNEEYYYSNGNKYKDLYDLRVSETKNFISNNSYDSLNENVKKVYSLANLENINKESEYSANSIDELTMNIINSLKTSIKNNTLSDNYYYNSYTYKYANGYSSDLDAIIRNNVDTILNDIQPVKIVMLPNIDQQTKTPIFDELRYKESKNDGSTSNFVLPGKVWDSLNNEAFVDQYYLQNNYVVVNPNVLVDVSQKSDNTSTMTGVEAESLVDQKALNSFSVASKTITKQDYINATSFSKLTNTYDKYQVYEVSDSTNGTLYFLSQEDALNYYFKTNNMKLHELTPTKYVYVFDNKEFESKNELYVYVKERIVEVR